MKNLTLLFALPACLSFLGCSEDPGIYDISGRALYDSGNPAASASVFLDGAPRSATDTGGYFTIPDVPEGKHTLKVFTSDAASGYSESETEINLSGGDLDLEELLLPVPVRLLDPTVVTSTSLTITWNRSHAGDFREYKIYLHNSSALDESTGTLLHIATDVNDTVLTVTEGDFWWAGSTLTPNTTYYFRVFVMNAYGRYSGSNILEVTTSLWDNPDLFTCNYSLEPDFSFAAQGKLTGIVWDGACFWMLYFEAVGGYYDNNRLTLVRYDLDSGTVLQEIVFDDSNYGCAGITWDGEQVWISLYTHIRSVNLSTGEWDKMYQIGEGTEDLAWTGEELVVLDTWNKITLLDPVNGMISNQFDTPCKAIGFSGERGVAFRQGEIWVINCLHHEICILDPEGNHIGVAETDFISQGTDKTNFQNLRMCFMGEKLVIAVDSHVRVYDLARIE